MTTEAEEHSPFDDVPRKERINAMAHPSFMALLDFANRVQKWSLGRWRRKREYGTFGQAARWLKCSPDTIADAVQAHYWMFTQDLDLPVSDRRIEHEGE